MSETLHQERRANTALEPEAVPLLRSTFAREFGCVPSAFHRPRWRLWLSFVS